MAGATVVQVSATSHQDPLFTSTTPAPARPAAGSPGAALTLAWREATEPAPADVGALERLPGGPGDEVAARVAAGWLVGHGGRTAIAYRRDLGAWAVWCEQAGVTVLDAQRVHVDAWVRHLSTVPRPGTGRVASAATIARALSAISGFYTYAVSEAEVIERSPVAAVRRPRVSQDSTTAGLSASQLRALLETAAAHSARSGALVAVLACCGVRISEALGADVGDYGYDGGHRVLAITRKGGIAAKVVLAPPVVRALDAYLEGRDTGPLFTAADGRACYAYSSAYEQIGRLCARAGLPPGISPHSLRHSYATEALRLGVALTDVQDALGHADPRTTRRYDRARHLLDRSPNYLIATVLAGP